MRYLLIFFLVIMMAGTIDITPVNIRRPEDQEITITVIGAVEEPGTIALPLHATIGDALKQIRVTSQADPSLLNPQTVLNDHDVLNIPAGSSSSFRISINSGTKEDLAQLNGIGPKLAQKIVDYREENGLFQNLEDLMNVSGIGKVKYEKIKDSISL